MTGNSSWNYCGCKFFLVKAIIRVAYVPRFHSCQRKQSKNKVAISITPDFHATWQVTNGEVIVEGTSMLVFQLCKLKKHLWSQFSQQWTISKVTDTWNLRVDCKIDRNFCYLFPGEKRCTGMENMELTTIDKIEMANFCFFYR